MTNFELFLQKYETTLTQNVTTHPDRYRYQASPEKISQVSLKMVEGLRDSESDKNGETTKSVCRQLGIKHTYAAIEQYLKS